MRKVYCLLLLAVLGLGRIEATEKTGQEMNETEYINMITNNKKMFEIYFSSYVAIWKDRSNFISEADAPVFVNSLEKELNAIADIMLDPSTLKKNPEAKTPMWATWADHIRNTKADDFSAHPYRITVATRLLTQLSYLPSLAADRKVFDQLKSRLALHVDFLSSQYELLTANFFATKMKLLDAKNRSNNNSLSNPKAQPGAAPDTNSGRR